MWRRLPLNAKLLLSVFGVQAVALAIGSYWLTRWLGDALYADLETRVDAQSDVVEDMVVLGADGALTGEIHGEGAREIDSDPDVYFLVLAPDGRVITEAHGPAPETREALRILLTSGEPRKRLDLMTVDSDHWLVQKEATSKRFAGGSLGATVFTVIDAQPVLDEIARFGRYSALAALGILAVTTFGTGFVVSHSTRNLRRFAHQLASVQPGKFDVPFDLVPQSAEETLVFANYTAMLAALRAAHDAQQLFIANASHELKTPVAAALIAAEVALSGPESAPAFKRTLIDIQAELKILSRLSSGLLDLARLELAPVSSQDETTSIEDVVSLVIARWTKPAATRGIVIRTSGSVDAVVGSPSQWEIVLGNLVDNAVKYGRSNGSIEVSLARRGSTAEVSVADDGIGMGPEDVAKLGHVFFRSDAARHDAGSFGLGYAHAQRIVAQLGGTVRVDSQLGKGSTVTVSAPLAL